MCIKNEIFKDIEGYEGLYKISNFGNVFSVERLDKLNRVQGGKLLKTVLRSGYPSVKLSKSGISKLYTVHRLMAKAFLSDFDDSLVVDHIDGNRENNTLTNLRCVSQLENVLNPNTRLKQINNLRKKCCKKIKQYTLEHKFIKEFNSLTEAEKMLKISHTGISLCCTGKLKTYKGFIFEPSYQ